MDLDLEAYGRLSESIGGAASANSSRDFLRSSVGAPMTSLANTPNHRRSSFTEYRSPLGGTGLSDDLTTMGSRGTYGGGPGHHYSRDDTMLHGGRDTTSKYLSTPISHKNNSQLTSSLFDKYSSHLDDNNNSSLQHRQHLHNHHHHDTKYNFLGDNTTTRRELDSQSLTNHSSSLFDTLTGIPTTATTTATTTTASVPANTSTSAISGLPITSGKYTSSYFDPPPTTTTTASSLRTNQLLTHQSNAAGKSSALESDGYLSATLKDVLGTQASNAPSHAHASNAAELQMMAQQVVHDTVDSIEIPARGRCKVFMAKYGYNPFKQSPNDNPDAELAFNAGDYIMVFDDIDEDGYFIGELMDGRRGYVPSNWLYRLTSDDLFEFQANVLYKQAGGGDNQGGPGSDQTHLHQMQLQFGGGHAAATNTNSLLQASELDDCLMDNNSNSNYYPPEFYDAIIQDTMNHSNFQHLLAPEDYHRMNDYVDLEDVNEVDDECLSDYERAEAEQMRRAVPPPQRLVLERQLNKCILIAWLHPQATKGSIVSYQVYVDGVLKSTVPSGDRTKALLEGVDSNIPHRISVRAIDVNGRYSNDAGCTIVIGQKIPFAPSCVKASHITSDSALISWLPCNSNFHHVVAVNSVEVQTVRPGVYKHLINGLSANTLYRVWVRAKPGKILSIDEKNPKKLESLTTYVDFKTMPKSLPDPPVNVQVEAGPQRRTLLVTWLPLTLNDFGSSNGCAVTGYAVFAGHKKLAEIDSPTGDHALLDIGELESLHKKSVTVRTKSGENLSQDSMPCQIPDEYLKSTTSAAVSSGSASYNQQMRGHHHQASSTSISHSPSRQRMGAGASALPHHQQQQRGAVGHSARAYHPGQHSHLTPQQQHNRTSRPLTRSLHNLESDLESRRSSIPAIEITREASGSEFMTNQTESFSEEEFENSMRFRSGHQMRGRVGGRAATGQLGRLRPRQSHSVDGHQLVGPRHQLGQSQASLGVGAAAGVPVGQRGLRGMTPHGDVRYFVALFDYDPSTMSPNPNAATEELAFKEGAIIKVHGGLGEDGFYKGELVDTQATGYVPCNVITEINDPNVLASLHEKHSSQMVGQPPPLLAARQAQPLLVGGAGVMINQQLDQMQQQQPQNQQQAAASGAVKRMVAMYDYDPQENSPNADTESEIPFKTGDIIFVYGKMDTDGFYMGEVERTKQRGLVPSNFLREEPLPVGAMTQQTSLSSGGVQKGPMGFSMNPQQQNQSQVMQLQHQQQQFNVNQQAQPFGGPGGQAALNNQQQMQQLRGLQQQQANLIRGQMCQQQQPNINRPNSLSLGAQTQNNPQQQQQMMMNNQQQMQAMQLQQQNGLMQTATGPQQLLQQQLQQSQPHQANSANLAPGGMSNQVNQFNSSNQMMVRGMGNMMNQPRAMGLANQQQQIQQNMQQQQGTGGVLSNLLSSGKQIIGAATTPRVPNQPGGFPGPGGLVNMTNQQQLASGNQMMMSNQMPPADNSASGVASGQFGAMGQRQMQPQLQQGQSAVSSFNQQQQPTGLIGDNSMQPNTSLSGGMGGGFMGNQQHHHHQQQQQQPPYSQTGNFGQRHAGMTSQGGMSAMNQMGEGDQGGNILNTVKNIFKL